MRQSGTLTWKPHISKRGNAYIRASLYMAAVSSIIHNKTLKLYFNRLKENGKPGKTGVVALERKLLILIYTLFKNDQDYIEHYQNDVVNGTVTSPDPDQGDTPPVGKNKNSPLKRATVDGLCTA